MGVGAGVVSDAVCTVSIKALRLASSVSAALRFSFCLMAAVLAPTAMRIAINTSKEVCF